MDDLTLAEEAEDERAYHEAAEAALDEALETGAITPEQYAQFITQGRVLDVMFLKEEQ